MEKTARRAASAGVTAFLLGTCPDEVRTALRRYYVQVKQCDHVHVPARAHDLERVLVDIVIPVRGTLAYATVGGGPGVLSLLCTLCAGSALVVLTIQPKKASNGMNGVIDHC